MEIVSEIVEIYASAAGQITQIWILLTKFPRRKWVKGWNIAVWFLLNFCLAHFMIFSNLIQSVLSMGVMAFTSCILLEGRISGKILTVVVCNIFMILVSMMRSRLAFFLSGEEMAVIGMQGAGIPARLVGIVLTNSLYLLTAYVLTKFLNKPVKLKREEYTIIAICYGLFFGIVLISIAVMENTAFSVRWQISFLMLDILMLIANIVILKLVIHMNRQNCYEMENAMLRLQLSQQAARILQEEKNYKEIQSLRHDMKRYFTTYRQLIRDGKYEMVERDIDHILGKRLNVKCHHYTDDAIVNAVMNEKAQKCEEAQIAFAAQIQMPEKMESMEFGMILSNLLDNAIEAEQKEAEENRYISLTIETEQGMMHLIVRNYIAESVLADNPNLKTSKQKKKLHGIGIKEVREFVSRQKGEIEIFEEEHMFVVHVFLTIKNVEK